MLLAIEQGNTNTLFAVHDGEKWTAQWRAATHASRTADEYAVWLSQLLGMAGLQLGVFNGCIISSVVPQSIFNLRHRARHQPVDGGPAPGGREAAARGYPAAARQHRHRQGHGGRHAVRRLLG